MADIALYRKYRPQKFGDLVGQDHVRITLQNAVKENALSHAYLLCGTRGTGKTSSARLIAKALNCETPTGDGEPCDKCDMCKALAEGNLIDLIEIDAASNRGIDEIRDLKEKLHFAPTRAKAKVYIIDEVHMLTKEAFNALLKTLEEPPAHSYFILATTEVHKIPETIISRCQRFDFKRIAEESLVKRLEFIAESEKIEAEKEALEMIVHQVNGGMRDAIGLLEQLSGTGKISAEDVKQVLGVTGSGPLKKLYKHLCDGNSAAALDLVQELFVEGQDFGVFVKEMMWFLRGEMVGKVQAGDSAGAYEDLKMIELAHKVIEQMSGAPIPQLPLEAAIMKICEGKTASAPTPAAAPVVENKPAEAAPVAEVPAPPVPAAPAVEKKEEVVIEKTEPPQEKEPKEEKSSEIAEAKKETAAPVEAEAPAEKKAAPATPPGDNKAFSIEDLQSKWKEIMAKVSSPALRMSLQQGKITSASADAISIGFSSNFHLDKVNQSAELVMVQEAVMETLGQSMKVTTVLVEAVEIPKPSDTADQLIEKAEELFG